MFVEGTGNNPWLLILTFRLLKFGNITETHAIVLWVSLSIHTLLTKLDIVLSCATLSKFERTFLYKNTHSVFIELWPKYTADPCYILKWSKSEKKRLNLPSLKFIYL